MQRPTLILSMAFVTLLLSSTAASAISYMYMPERVRLMNAELVVIGKMTNVKQGQRSKTGTLAISRTLKGDASIKNAEMSWQDLTPFGGSKGHRSGQSGVWILNKARDGKYVTGYPDNFVAANQLKRVQQGLKEISALKWTMSNGLSMTCIAEFHKPTRSRSRPKPGQSRPTVTLSIYPFVKNVSKRTVRVYDNQAERIFTLSITTSKGASKSIDLYPNLKSKARAHVHMFRRLTPGQIRAVGTGLHVNSITRSGTYVLKLSYENKHDGQEFGLRDVWHGKLNLTPQTVSTSGRSRKRTR